MGRYDDITPERLRRDLVRFANLVIRLEKENRIPASAAQLQKILGDLRQELFAFEIRSCHFSLEPAAGEAGHGTTPYPAAVEETDPVIRNSLKVVREALRRGEEMLQEWQGKESREDVEDDE